MLPTPILLQRKGRAIDREENGDGIPRKSGVLFDRSRRSPYKHPTDLGNAEVHAAKMA